MNKLFMNQGTDIPVSKSGGVSQVYERLEKLVKIQKIILILQFITISTLILSIMADIKIF